MELSRNNESVPEVQSIPMKIHSLKAQDSKSATENGHNLKDEGSEIEDEEQSEGKEEVAEKEIERTKDNEEEKEKEEEEEEHGTAGVTEVSNRTICIPLLGKRWRLQCMCPYTTLTEVPHTNYYIY